MSSDAQVEPTRRTWGAGWLLMLVPLLLLGIILALIVTTGGGLRDLAGPPVEQLTVQRVILPMPGLIQVEVINDGPQSITVAQVQVDDAYWSFTVEPAATIPRLGRATLTIPYPWVNEEAHVVRLVSELGATFDAEIAVAVESPQPSASLFLRFGLVGLYVGIVPVMLGLLWYPFLRKLNSAAMNFILSLTVGLLIYLAVGTWLDATEFAAELPAFWQGIPMVIFVALLSLGTLLMLNARRGERTPLQVSYLIALGIGLHNLGEGLAIGAAFSLGEAALGIFLVLGFTLHNITEGIGIAAPVVRAPPGWRHFVALAVLAGGPAIVGTWVGGYAFDPVLATVFLAIGIGAIVQVIWEVGKLVARDNARAGRPAVNWITLSGVVAGVAIMYFTAFLVKF